MTRSNVIRVKWTGVRDTETALRDVPVRARRGAVLGLEAIAIIMQNRCRQGIQKGPKTGRIYSRRTVTHQASAPGEFPSTDTGELVRSVIGEVFTGTLEAVLSAGTKYAKWLEMGTQRMWPRPFLQPTLDDVSKEAPAILRRYVRRELQNG